MKIREFEANTLLYGDTTIYINNPDTTWRYEIIDRLGNLICKNGKPKKKVLEFIEILDNRERYENYLYYGCSDYIAEYNPMRRLISVYDRDYFINRMRGANFKNPQDILICNLNSSGCIVSVKSLEDM